MRKTTKNKRPRIPHHIHIKLEECKEYLEIYLDETNPGCSVNKKARKDSRIYLDTWVNCKLAVILAWAEGRE
jgi:hypothetical protein